MLATHYRVFMAVASHLSFSKAAEVLYISQPAVSKHVKKLESELGIPLFERRGGGILLTPQGQKLLEYLHRVQMIEKQVESDVEIIRDQMVAKGELRLGASTTLSLYVLPRILSRFRKKFPKVKLLLSNRNSENIVKALLNKEIDLAVIETQHRVRDISYQHFTRDEIIAICSSHSPYANKVFDVEELKDLQLALREQGSGTLDVLKHSLTRAGLKMGDLNIVARLGGTEALKKFLIEDTSLGFLSRLAVQHELDRGLLKEVEIRKLDIVRDFGFGMRQGEEVTGIIRSFIKDARQGL